ncbi:FAD-dependent monooxygenase [Sphingobium subterraneum]|uniref:2-polyprenyl-6-methoxyphenol hydroxylase-like FAD-dependent oxidoreductase n=1 Tax=Sphingobium subterraneum TaxID=627688 RepID=A0A841J0L1_9SPHN|nr:FAD-dependent monooxygenase [Sphingobium subterraneum]MBB6123066.1 2-polyprenyl-6-methoxyphenol hydroxylase-like FAD-dependent oxidoreductase [Sphingobium subterraneum]
MRAIIVGGSIAGLFTANMLERAGWDVVVVERTGEALSSRGAGVVTHPELFAGLEAAGLTPDDIETVAVDGRILFGADGSREQTLHLPQRLVAWGELHGRLESVWGTSRVMRGASVVGYEESENSVSVQLTDGRSLTADVLIGADGLRSTVRRLMLPDEAPIYAGYVAWRGLVAEEDLSPDVAADLMNCFSFGFPAGEQILGYPVGRPGGASADLGRQLNYVWYRPVEDPDQLQAMFTDANGKVHRDGIPPALLLPTILADMRREAVRVLPPQLAAAVQATRQPLLQPIYDYAASRMASGRVALVGDAAAVARPHCGMGVTKAGSDAVALSRALAASPDDVPAALQHYDAQRRPTDLALMHHAQELGASIGSGKPAVSAMEGQRLMRAVAVAPELGLTG